ncbi:Oxidoreductase OS=Streptomyces alboniger OX=132473 GN=CP975_19305 PE=4 SV=1 [Streptomyces alboniger]
MSTTGAAADPLAALGELPGVDESVESVRKSVGPCLLGHRVMRRRNNAITSEAALRGASRFGGAVRCGLGA